MRGAGNDRLLVPVGVLAGVGSTGLFCVSSGVAGFDMGVKGTGVGDDVSRAIALSISLLKFSVSASMVSLSSLKLGSLPNMSAMSCLPRGLVHFVLGGKRSRCETGDDTLVITGMDCRSTL